MVQDMVRFRKFLVQKKFLIYKNIIEFELRNINYDIQKKKQYLYRK